MDYWEALGRLVSAEDELREARLQLGEGEIARFVGCLSHVMTMVVSVEKAAREEGIDSVSAL